MYICWYIPYLITLSPRQVCTCKVNSPSHGFDYVGFLMRTTPPLLSFPFPWGKNTEPERRQPEARGRLWDSSCYILYVLSYQNGVTFCLALQSHCLWVTLCVHLSLNSNWFPSFRTHLTLIVSRPWVRWCNGDPSYLHTDVQLAELNVDANNWSSEKLPFTAQSPMRHCLLQSSWRALADGEEETIFETQTGIWPTSGAQGLNSSLDSWIMLKISAIHLPITLPHDT